MSDAAIILSVHGNADLLREHLAALVAAAREGFKVDGWEVIETAAIYGQPFKDPIGNFEIGDPVNVFPWQDGVSFGGWEGETAHEGRGPATVGNDSPEDGSLYVTYDDDAFASEWVHHTSLELR